MKKPNLRILTLAGLAVASLAASAPSWARDYDDYSRHGRYERDYRDDHRDRHSYNRNRPDRHRFDRRHEVVVTRPVYVQQRPVIIERRVYVEQPVYNQAPQGSLGEILGGAIGAYIEERATAGR